MCDNRFRLQEVEAAIKKLKHDKAPGPNGLLVEFYQKIFDYVAPFVCRLFNLVTRYDSLPTSMRQGIISLIPKVGKDSLILDDWRPITLLNCAFCLHFSMRLRPTLYFVN